VDYSLSEYERLKQCIYEGEKKKGKEEKNGVVELTMEDVTAEPKPIEEEEWVRFYKQRECPFGKRYGVDHKTRGDDACNKCRQTYPQLHDACLEEWDKIEDAYFASDD